MAGIEDFKIRFGKIADETGHLESDIARAMNRLNWEASEKEAIRQQISRARTKAKKLHERSDAMQKYVNKASQEFSNTDHQIAKKAGELSKGLENIWQQLLTFGSQVFDGLKAWELKELEALRNLLMNFRIPNISPLKVSPIHLSIEQGVGHYINSVDLAVGIVPIMPISMGLEKLIQNFLLRMKKLKAENAQSSNGIINKPIQNGSENGTTKTPGTDSSSSGYSAEFSYLDKNGNKITNQWTISDDEFVNSKSLTQDQITAICQEHNPGLVKRGFDKAIYQFAQDKGINPKVLLATLAQEQSWCKSKNDSDGPYQRAFGVGPGGDPISFVDSKKGMAASVNTYMRLFEEGKKLEDKGALGPILVNRDGPPYKETTAVFGDRTSQWQNSNPGYVKYMEKGQEITPVNAVMYAKLHYTPWIDFPPQQSHPLDDWQNHYNSIK
ncbi:MAG TPA: hypothetical protein VN426_11450 [Syntrophomonadaceae bacterium]|nr:hypothetical protein [Syntrophomonadaceae bacterium]